MLPLRGVQGLFLERQHLARLGPRRLTARSLAAFVDDVGGLQLDSINVLERAHYLTVWSRFGAYDRATLDRLCYERRVLFEFWAHAACLVPVAHLPAWRCAMLDYQPRHTGYATFLKRHAPTLHRVEAAIREGGPRGNADFREDRPAGGDGWWSWGPTAHALDYLWKSGVLAVSSRRNFQRRLDLIERVLPGVGAVTPLSTAEFHRWRVRRSLHALGAAPESDLNAYLTFPRGAAVRRRALAELRRAGEVREVAVAGTRAPWLALAEDLPALERAAARRTPGRGTTLVSPFDSLLWVRERVARLFGFHYRVEIYTPREQRVHGYYTLPLLHDGRLVGRVDAKNHRASRRLEVKHAHFEPWLAAGAPPPPDGTRPLEVDAVLAGLAGALRSLAALVGAEAITVGRTTPPRWAAPLRRAVGR